MWERINQGYQQCYQQFFDTETYHKYLIYAAFPLRRLPDFLGGTVGEWINGLSGDSQTQFLNYVYNVIPEEIQFIEQWGVGIISRQNLRYPERLNRINYPPVFLFYCGHIGDYVQSIAVVGTRKVDQYGTELTQFLTRESVRLGFNIVSGAAKGVDQIAQSEALISGGQVVVVPGTGLGHHLRYEKIREGVTLITEFPLFFRGNRQSFPIRNRVISGLALGTIMVQAPQKSGALYTANYCLKEGKPLFVPPGNLFDPLFGGNVELLGKKSDQIHLITGGETLARVFQRENIHIQKNIVKPLARSAPISGGDPIMGILENSYPKEVQFDQICHLASLTPSVVIPILMQLELSGGVIRLPGGYYRIQGVQ